MALCQWRRSPGRLECIHCGRVINTSSRTAGVRCPKNPGKAWLAVPPRGGPGTELKRLLSGWPFYITTRADCPCQEHADRMDAWGADECERRMDEIVGWLRGEATRRGLPFLDAAGRILVRRAIRRSRQARPPS